MGCFVISISAQQPGLTDTTVLTPQKDVIDLLKKLFKADQNKIDSSP